MTSIGAYLECLEALAEFLIPFLLIFGGIGWAVWKWGRSITESHMRLEAEIKKKFLKEALIEAYKEINAKQ